MPDEPMGGCFRQVGGKIDGVPLDGNVEVTGWQIEEQVTNRSADKVDGGPALVCKLDQAR